MDKGNLLMASSFTKRQCGMNLVYDIAGIAFASFAGRWSLGQDIINVWQ